jgi:hypothetical protein
MPFSRDTTSNSQHFRFALEEPYSGYIHIKIASAMHEERINIFKEKI